MEDKEETRTFKRHGIVGKFHRQDKQSESASLEKHIVTTQPVETPSKLNSIHANAKNSLNHQLLDLTLHLRPKSDKGPGPRNIKLSLSEYPRTGLELKKSVENQLQIPVCMQRICIGCTELSNNQLLRPLYLRDEDILTVDFITEADTKKVDEALAAMVLMTLNENQSINVLDHDPVEALVVQCLLPVGSERVVANRNHFVYNGGMELTIALHKQLASRTLNCMSLEMLYLERSVLMVLCDLSATTGTRNLLLKQPGFVNQLCMSVLKQQIFPYQEVPVPMEEESYDNTVDKKQIALQKRMLLVEIMIRAMGVLTNLSELHSHRLEIARQPKIIEQMTSAMLSRSFSIFSVHVIISALVNLSYTPETHQYLTSPPILHGIVEACKKDYTTSALFVKHSDIIIIKYYATMFFSFLSTGSSAYINSEGFDSSFPDVLSLMRKFLKKYSCQQVKKVEDDAGYSWSTFKPLVHLVYFSYTRHAFTEQVNKKPLIRDLYLTSIESAIFCLNNACSSQACLSILEDEGLTDFIICLPWFIPKELKDRACEVVQLMSQGTKLQPPKLLNIVKAGLASWFLPLGELLSPSFIDHLFNHFYKM